jgi:hypothetical protein
MRTRAPVRWSLALASLGVVIAFVLLDEHWGHTLGALPYLLLLACPLLHLFSHRGRGVDHGRAAHPPTEGRDPSTHVGRGIS